jgi:hypothetical protein
METFVLKVGSGNLRGAQEGSHHAVSQPHSPAAVSGANAEKPRNTGLNASGTAQMTGAVETGNRDPIPEPFR